MTDDSVVYTAGIWTVKPGKEEEFKNSWIEFATWSFKNAPGGISVELLRGVDDPRIFLTVGPWRDEESIAAWRALPEFRQFFAKARQLCDDIKPMSMRSVFTLQ